MKKSKMLSIFLTLLMLGIILIPNIVFADPKNTTEGLSGGIITSFNDLEKKIRYQKGQTVELPETVAATVNGQSKPVPITWMAEGYTGDFMKKGMFVFEGNISGDFVASEGLVMPKITFLSTGAGRMAGIGDAATPLEITNSSQLAEIAELVNNGGLESYILGSTSRQVHFKLMNDITLSSYAQWIPIGNSSSPFKGVFDGDGKTISDLKIIGGTMNYAGLFGSNSGTIKNLNVTNVNIIANDYVGAVAGNNTGTISDCYASGSITATGSNKGRITGVDTPNLSGNYAAFNMKVNGATVTGGTITNKNGANKEGFDGSGNSLDPYQIATADQLAYLADRVNVGDTNYNSEHYKLTADIDLSAYSSWTPIGWYDSVGSIDYPFNGTFNGDGHVVTNLTINSTADYVGLFGLTGSGAETTNLGVENVSIIGVNYVGVIVGFNNGGTVSNCYSTGSVKGSDSVGGVVGGSAGSNTVSNCYSTGSVEGSDSVGGVVGRNFGPVQNCVALNPSITGTSNVGRVIGQNFGSTTGNYAFAGMTLTPSSSIANNANDKNGKDKTTADIGKIYNDPSNDTDLYGIFSVGSPSPWTTKQGDLPGLGGNTVNMPPHLGGLGFAGGDGLSPATAYEIATADQLAYLAKTVNNGNPYTNTYFKLTADIDLFGYSSGTGWTPIGKPLFEFSGTFDGDGHIVKNLTINAPNLNRVGLFGFVRAGAEITNLGVENANITGLNSVGIIVGENYALVSNCYSTGVSKGTNNGVGGIVGYNEGTVSNSYSTGFIEGNLGSGGIVGYNVSSGTVSNSYSTGSVNGYDRIGGIVGYNNTGTVSNCVALNMSASTTGGPDVGRVVGNSSGGSMTDNYALKGMTLTPSGAIIDDADDIDGGSINKDQATTNVLYASLGWDFGTTGEWSQAVEYLPILKNIGGNQNGDFGLYLTKQNILFSSVTVNPTSGIHTGSSHNPAITVMFGSKTLVESIDYNITIKNSGNATVTSMTAVGVYKIEIEGTGEYEGSHTTATYEITSSSSNSSSSNSSSNSSSSNSSSSSSIPDSSNPNTSSSNNSSSNTSTRSGSPSYSDSTNNYKNFNDAYNSASQNNNEYEYQTLTHTETGVSVSAHFTKNAKLIVTHINESGSIIAYDISVDGRYKGMLEISIPVDSEYNGKDIYVIHKGKNGTENIKVSVENGFIKFKVSDLSPFILKKNLQSNAVLSSNQTKAEYYNPKTGG